MFVVYSNDEEVLVTTKRRECKFIKESFTEGGRDLEDYDREEVSGSGVGVGSKLVSLW